MFGFITKIDEGLMKFFQRKSEKVQTITGYDCLGQSLIAVVVSSTCLSCVYYFSTFNLATKIIFGGFAPLLWFYSANTLYEYAKKDTGDLEEGVKPRSPLYEEHRKRRELVLSVVFFILLSEFFDFLLSQLGFRSETSVFIVIGVVAFLCFEYLISCTPLPPGKSKVRKFLDSLRGSPKTAENEST